jgi:hypothetical protein
MDRQLIRYIRVRPRRLSDTANRFDLELFALEAARIDVGGWGLSAPAVSVVDQFRDDDEQNC